MERCGIFQYGRSMHEILKSDYTSDFNTDFNQYDRVIFNWHPVVMPDLNDHVLSNISAQKVVIGGHDFAANFSNADFNLNCSDIPRPIFSRYNFTRPKSKIPIIGSFGFPFGFKNFENLVSLCSDNFETSILRLHLPQHDFNSQVDLDTTNRIQTLCEQKGNVELQVSNGFLSIPELIEWLAANSINVFLYGPETESRGVSSAIDYALAAKTPIAISDSHMFRHINHEDRILLSKNSLKDILELGDAPMKQFWDKHTEQSLIDFFQNL